MSFLKRLFGLGRDDAREQPFAGEAIEYKGYTIRATPFSADGQYQTCGVVGRETEDGPREYRFIRADRFPTIEGAAEQALRKGRQLVDEQGDRMFREEG